MDEREEGILKIALCGKYQEKYSDISTLCKLCGLTDADRKQIEGWKYHGRAADPLILRVIFDYIEEYEKERFDNSYYLYYRNMR